MDAAVRLLVEALPTEQPSVVVLDEMPYLVGNDPGFEGTLQTLFDRAFSRRPVLLLGIGMSRTCLTFLPATVSTRTWSTVDEVTTFEPEDLLSAWRRYSAPEQALSSRSRPCLARMLL